MLYAAPNQHTCIDYYNQTAGVSYGSSLSTTAVYASNGHQCSSSNEADSYFYNHEPYATDKSYAINQTSSNESNLSHKNAFGFSQQQLQQPTAKLNPNSNSNNSYAYYSNTYGAHSVDNTYSQSSDCYYY
jgi:hypothetical protein